MPLIGYLEQIFLFLRGKLGEMMTLFHTVAFCGHLWQCFKKMANLVHKLNICSFWLETLCQGQKNSEANFCFPRHNVFQPKGYIFLGFHRLTFHTPLLVWPQWWSFTDVSQQGLRFSKKISRIRIFFRFDFHRCSHGPSKSA